jgi:hypothetical protein
MQRFDFQIGVTVAVFLHGEFAKRNLWNGRGKRTAADVIAFFAPQPAPNTVGFEVIER